MSTEDQNHDDEAVKAASEVIESATANLLIEMQVNKAIRLGTMLRIWRQMMLSNGSDDAGIPFPEDWVDSAAMDIFHTLFPEKQEEEYDGDDD